jgi:hypothetical protein
MVSRRPYLDSKQTGSIFSVRNTCTRMHFVAQSASQSLPPLALPAAEGRAQPCAAPFFDVIKAKQRHAAHHKPDSLRSRAITRTETLQGQRVLPRPSILWGAWACMLGVGCAATSSVAATTVPC